MKAGLGSVMDGRTFGYRNVDVMTGHQDGSVRPIRSHVTREIDPEQAKVVREIAERYAGGQGFKKIADALNRKCARTPRPKLGRIAGWDVSSVRAVLLQPLYRGVARWNRLRQRDDEGNPISRSTRRPRTLPSSMKHGGSSRRTSPKPLIAGSRRTRRRGAVSAATPA